MTESTIAIDTNVLVYAVSSDEPAKSAAVHALLASLWDAMLIAACHDAGVSILYTEDRQSADRFGNLEILNPFTPA